MVIASWQWALLPAHSVDTCVYTNWIQLTEVHAMLTYLHCTKRTQPLVIWFPRGLGCPAMWSVSTSLPCPPTHAQSFFIGVTKPGNRSSLSPARFAICLGDPGFNVLGWSSRCVSIQSDILNAVWFITSGNKNLKHSSHLMRKKPPTNEFLQLHLLWSSCSGIDGIMHAHPNPLPSYEYRGRYHQPWTTHPS